MKPMMKGGERMTYLITYDLNRPRQDYQGLYQAIKQIGHWRHALQNT